MSFIREVVFRSTEVTREDEDKRECWSEPHESSSSLSPDEGVPVREEAHQPLYTPSVAAGFLLTLVRRGEVAEEGGCSAADQGGGMGEERDCGGEGATLQTLGRGHRETPVEGGQQQLLWREERGGGSGEEG